MYACGGAHGRVSIVMCIDKATVEKMLIPSFWQNWPGRFYWLEGPIEDYKELLITLGTWDNEVVQKTLTFVDKITGCRSYFEEKFGDLQGYLNSEREARFAFVPKILGMYQIPSAGDAGKYRDLVRVEKSTWTLLHTIMTGNFHSRNFVLTFSFR
jgi:hypothetical protein